MSQQINLFNPIFRKQGFSFISAAAMLYGVAIVLACAALVGLYQKRELAAVESQAQAVATAHEEATAEVARLTAQLAKQKPNAALEAEIAVLDMQLQGRQDVIDTLKSGAVGNTEGFSEYMRAFSRQNVAGLWLTGFDIAGNDLAIQGRTVNAELVADYLRGLNQEKSLNGRQFAALRMGQAQAEPVAPGKTGPVAPATNVPPAKDAKLDKPPSPRYLEFTISTTTIAETARAAVGSASTEPPLLGTISTASVLDAGRATAPTEAAK